MARKFVSTGSGIKTGAPLIGINDSGGARFKRVLIPERIWGIFKGIPGFRGYPPTPIRIPPGVRPFPALTDFVFMVEG